MSFESFKIVADRVSVILNMTHIETTLVPTLGFFIKRGRGKRLREKKEEENKEQKQVLHSQYIHALLLLFIIFIEAKFILPQEVDNYERDFDYSPDGKKGPRKWGEIKKEWVACNNGDMQSPIDLSNERVVQISQPENMNFKASNATFKNIQIKWIGDAGSIFINDTVYRLRYAHWHSPSEHTINGIRYDMELHLVHLTEDPEVKIAVIGILYTIGKSDYFLSKLMTNISSMVGKRRVEMSLGIVDPNDIIIRSKRFYRYMGSLTIPPCTEGVIWTINKVVKSVSKDQVKLLREAVDYAEENARPLQQINNRGVHLIIMGQMRWSDLMKFIW